LNGKWNVLGYVEPAKDAKQAHPTETKEYSLEYLGKCEPRLSVSRPAAYLFPPSYTKAVDVLRRHGLTLEELDKETDVDTETYRVDKVSRSSSPFQTHRPVRVDATSRNVRRRLPAGTVVVRTDQRLGTLAVVLLEPQCEDGLTTWNF